MRRLAVVPLGWLCCLAAMAMTVNGIKRLCPEAEIPPPNCPVPKDCNDILDLGYSRSGVYTVYVGPYGEPLNVYCDQETDGGGWLVFQRRNDGSEDFNRGWYDYGRGFGNVYGEFWLGNRLLNVITDQTTYTLRVDMWDWTGATAFAKYDTFAVGTAGEKYALTVATYSGTAGDSLTYHNSMMFSTKDQDNDIVDYSCAIKFKGPWWHRSCHLSHLNGPYWDQGIQTSFADGVNWETWKGHYYSLKITEMKIRPT